MVSFLITSGVIFLVAIALATYIVIGELRHGHGRDD